MLCPYCFPRPYCFPTCLPQVYLEYVECPRLPRRARDARDFLSHKCVEETRFPDIGAAEEGDFGKGKSKCDVGAGERADEGGTGQASFF